MMKKTLLAILAIQFSLVQAQDFTAYFDTTTPQVEGNTIIMDGIRVEGFGFNSENDALKVRYVFNPETLNFELDAESVVTYMDVGVFHEEHVVAGDSLPQPTYTTADGEVVEIGIDAREFTVTADTPFVATFDLQIGHVMSWYFKPRTKDILYKFTGPNMDLEKIIPAREKLWDSPIKILTPGTYQLTVMPSNPEDTATFLFDAFNINNHPLTILADKDKVGERFNHLREYAKFQITLNQGDTLEVPAPVDENIAMKLVDKTSHLVVQVNKNLALTYEQTTKTDDYYLFIYQENEDKGRYNGKISITSEKTPKPDKTPNSDKNTDKPLTDDTSETADSENDSTDESDSEADAENDSTDESDSEADSENDSTDESDSEADSEDETSDNEEEGPSDSIDEDTESLLDSDNPEEDLDSFFNLLGEELENL